VESPWISELAEKLVAELDYVRSIDGLLVKLSTIVYDLSEHCNGRAECVSRMLEALLRDQRVSRSLSRFSCFPDEVSALASSNPRFKVLKPYIGLIEGVLKSIECRGGVVEKTREPTFRLEEEYIPVRVVKRPRRRSARRRLVSTSRIVYLALAAIGILIALYILLNTLNQPRIY